MAKNFASIVYEGGFSFDPQAIGLPAELNALYPRVSAQPPELWHKWGAGDTDWSILLANGLNNVRDFGALGDGVADDTVAIQAALDDAALNGRAGIILPAGTYNWTRDPATSASLDINGATSLMIIGRGAQSVLRMTGDGGASDWAGILIRGGASRIIIRDLLIDGNKAGIVNAGTETNLVKVEGTAVSQVEIDNVWFVNAFADGVQLRGDVGITGSVSKVWIHGCKAYTSGRHGFSVRRSTQFITLERCYVEGAADSAIHVEITDAVGASPSDILIDNNQVDHTGAVDANKRAVEVLGTSFSITRVTLTNNQVNNGNVLLQNVNRLIADTNTIVGHATGSEPTFECTDTTDSTIGNNIIVRPATAVAPRNHVFQLVHIGAAVPAKVIVSDNALIGLTDGTVVSLESVEDIIFTGNYVAHHGASIGANFGVTCRPTTTIMRRVQINENIIVGDIGGGRLSACVRFAPDPNAIEFVSVSNNALRGATNGVSFEVGAGGYTRHPIVTGNSYDVVTADIGGFGNVIAVVIAGGPGSTVATIGTSIFLAAASPVGAFDAPLGSLCMVRAGGAGTSLFVKEAATAAGWVGHYPSFTAAVGGIIGPAVVAHPVRALDATFLPSATRQTLVIYSVRVVSTLTIAGGQSGRIELRSDAASPPVTVQARVAGGQTGTAVIGLTVTDTAEGVLVYMVPEGHNVNLTTVNETGVPTYTLTNVTEITL